jgi:DNA-binding response OmpR family regulator
MLSGVRVLIVEDDVVVAADLAAIVEQVEGRVAGVAHTLSDARELIGAVEFDAAVLDIGLPDGDVTPVLERLQARHAAIIIYTGGELPAQVSGRHPELVVVHKPAPPSRIVAELMRAMRKVAGRALTQAEKDASFS